MFRFSVPCLMGVEGLVADELKFKGFQDVLAENGRVLFSGDESECARANIQLRCGERVLLRLADFEARSFDALFEYVKAIPWEDYIGSREAFPVKGFSLRSQLHSVPDCQRIIKKAVVERLKSVYHTDWLKEDGAKHQIQFSLLNDRCEIYLDTTGAPLFKRGYKLKQNEATLRETLAASIVKLARWRGREPLIDPFCGSGTIVIEAALTALNIAPGARRGFDAEQWGGAFADAFAEQKKAALASEKHEKLPILASDLDPNSVRLTRENAERAGIGDCMEYAVQDALDINWKAREGIMIANPPYGVRMLDQQEAQQLYRDLGRAMKGSPVKKYIISSDDRFEENFGQRADKRRKLYNGMIKCNLYMYYKGI
jgi:putative N6-adenine-specific DNA methylase